MATMNPFDTDSPQQDLISLEAIRRRADNLMLTLIWALWLVSLAAGYHHDDGWLALIVGSVLAIAATLLKALFHGTRPVRIGYAVILLAFAALLIQIGEGETEYHFSVFVLMSALLAWRDWLPLLVGAAVAAIHHLVFNYLQEWGLLGIKVFIHPGLHMVIFHGLFVVMQTAVLIFLAIRMEQDARTASEVAKLAGIINSEPGCLTLVADDHSSTSTFARTFSTTLDTMRNTLQQASHNVGQLLEGSLAMLQRNTSLSARTDKQASSLADAASAMAQLTGSATQTSEKASEVRRLAINASEVAREGGENIRAATRSMEQIRDESMRINGILELIDGIAFQTNILSLNASVEAARAGEHGKGFAVVASEVRTLAQRCEGAAKDIRQLIATSVERTQQGAGEVELAGITMQSIIVHIEQLRTFVDDLSLMSEQQRASISQMNGSIASIDASVQENVQHVAQTIQMAQQQQQQTDALKAAISVFRFGQA